MPIQSIFGRIILFVLVSPLLYSQILPDVRQHTLVLKGIHLTLQQEYDSAEAVFQSFIDEYPLHPAGYLYLAGMLQARYTDEGYSFNEKRYDSLLNVVELKSDPFIASTVTAPYGYFMAGSADAFRSYTKSENGNLPSGMYYGFSAGRSLERCLEADSTFLQAKNILGSFYYWRSKLAWIPFVPDRTEEGIRYIQEAFFHPYEKHLASHNLMVILTEEKRYADAEQYGKMMLADYPDNRLFLWNMMTVYERWNRQDKLKNVVQRLLASTLNARVVNRYTEAVCRLKLARFAAEEGKRESAADELRMVMALHPYTGKVKGDLKKKIQQAGEMLRSLDQ